MRCNGICLVNMEQNPETAHREYSRECRFVATKTKLNEQSFGPYQIFPYLPLSDILQPTTNIDTNNDGAHSNASIHRIHRLEESALFFLT